MNTTTVQVQYLNTAEGKRPPSIKDTTGKRYSIPAWMFPQLQVNGTYTVQYETVDKNNTTYYNITGFAGGLPTPQQQPAPTPIQIAQALPMAAPHTAPLPAGPMPSPDNRSEDIFICGVCNHAIAHQSYPLDTASLQQLIMNARQAWRNTR